MRWFRGSALLMAVGLLTGVIGVAASPAAAQVMPNTPINVSAQVGNNAAIISWASGGSGVSGTCATTEYFVTVYDTSERSMPVHAESMPITSGTSWYVDQLDAGAWYYVEVEAYGSACDEYSPNLGTARFLTPTTQVAVTAPQTRKKYKPTAVRELQASMSNGNLLITWTKPRSPNSSKRCVYVEDSNETHAAKSIEYNYLVENLTAGTDIADEYFYSAEQNLSKTVANSDLPMGIGHYLRVTVNAYSEACGQYSAQRTVTLWK